MRMHTCTCTYIKRLIAVIVYVANFQADTGSLFGTVDYVALVNFFLFKREKCLKTKGIVAE